MNLFSWLWIISWIGTCLVTQSLLKAAQASSQVPDSSVSIRNSSPLIAAPIQLPAEANPSLINAVFPLSTLPRSTPLSIPTAIASSAQVSPRTQSSFSVAELVNPTTHPSFDLLQTHPAPSYSGSSTVSNRLLQIVTSLSRWTRGISEALRLTAPLVTVVQINPPLNTDRWNMLALGELGVPPAAASDLPRQSCLGEDAEIFPPTLTSLYQVQVRGKAVADFPLQEQAERWADRLRQVLQMANFDPQTLQPVLLDGIPGGKAGDVPLFWVEPELAAKLDRSGELLAITWINNLRTALSVPALSLIEAQTKMHGLLTTDDRLEGTASWYGPYFHGRLTATGEIFNQADLTAAHPTLPFDTYLKVTNLKTGRAVIVRVNDRGPYFEDRSLDLSREAARCLNSEISGVVPYEAVIMKRASGAFDAAPAEKISADSPANPAAEPPVEAVPEGSLAQTAMPSQEAVMPPAEAPIDAGSPLSSEAANP